VDIRRPDWRGGDVLPSASHRLSAHSEDVGAGADQPSIQLSGQSLSTTLRVSQVRHSKNLKTH